MGAGPDSRRSLPTGRPPQPAQARSCARATTGPDPLAEAVRLVALQLFMTLLVVTFLVPTFWMLSSSLKVSTEVFAHPIVWLPKDPHWNNYVKAF